MIATKCMSFKRGGFVPPSNAYIETDGVASYIDLGFVPSASTTYEIDFRFTYPRSSETIIGSTNASNVARYRVYLSTAGSDYTLNFSSPTTSGGVYFAGVSDNRHLLSYDGDFYRLDDKSLGVGDRPSDTSETLLMGVNRRRMTNFGRVRYYSAKFWESGVLIRDLVPYSGPRGIGLLDKVNDVLYANANTIGTLTYGEE